VESASTVQRGLPPPVLPEIQPAGSTPTGSASKFMVSARAVEVKPAISAPKTSLVMILVITLEESIRVLRLH